MFPEPKADGGTAGISVEKQLQVPESASEAGKPVAGLKPDQTAAARKVPAAPAVGAAVLRAVSSGSKADGNTAGIAGVEQLQVPETGSPDESPALDEKMAPFTAVHPSRLAASSAQGKGAVVFGGNAEPAVSQPTKGDDSQDTSSVVIPMSGKSAEVTASVRHASANGYTAEVPASGSGGASVAKSAKPFSEETATALKLTDGIAAEREIAGEAQIPAGEAKNIRMAHETPVVPDGSAAGVDAAVRHDSPQRVHEAVEAPHTIKVQDQVFQVTRINAGRLEVTVHPEGLGKLDIEVNLSSGQIHARISASDTQVRDMLQRNLPDIMNALAAEGHTVGGLSIGLRDGREHPQQGPAEQPRAEVQKVAAADILPVRPVNNSIVSIFV
jgi:flagellar hook-length control protein FliK